METRRVYYLLPVGLLPGETREADGASRDAERSFRAGTGTGSRNQGDHARHPVRVRQAVLHTMLHPGTHVIADPLPIADRHSTPACPSHGIRRIQAAADIDKVLLARANRRFSLLFVSLAPDIHLLVHNIHYRQRRQSLRLLRISDLLGTAGDVCQTDEFAPNPGDIHADPDRLRCHASPIVAMRSHTERYLGFDNHTDAHRKRYSHMHVDLRGESGMSWN